MTNKIRVGVFGAGVAGHHHIEAFSRISESVELVGFTEIDDVRRLEIQNEFDVAGYDSTESLIAAEINLGVVALPHDQLFECSVALYDAGCHLLVEKPMGNTLEQAKRLVEIYSQNDDLVASVSFVHRFRPVFTKVYSLLANKILGSVVAVHEHFMHPGDDRVPKWVWDSSKSGGGILLYSGIHNIDRILWFVNGEATLINGLIGKHSHEFDVEDGVCANIRFDNGTYSSLVGNQPFAVVPTTISRTEVYCKEGTITVSNGTELTYANSNGEIFEERYDSVGHFEYQANNIVNSIMNGEKPLVSLIDGVRAYELADNIYKSYWNQMTIDCDNN
ncbi:MAG TPA: hypothetical protein DGM69_03300 [Chloroflexi bacterium]|nr:hypothetical protein [Chloroflexota bacterium]